MTYIPDILDLKKTLVCFCTRSHVFSNAAYVALDPPLFNIRGLCYSNSKSLVLPKNCLLPNCTESLKDLISNPCITKELFSYVGGRLSTNGANSQDEKLF